MVSKKRPQTLKRTITYWRLVDHEKTTIVPEFDWDAFVRSISVTRHRIVERVVTGVSWAVENPDPEAFMHPAANDVFSRLDDETIMGLVASIDRDYLPAQQYEDGSQKPMPVDDGASPTVNSFLWFLPYGNFFAYMQEDRTAVSATTMAIWISKILRDSGQLPYGCHGLKAVPVIDNESRRRLESATALKSVMLSGEVSSATNGVFNDILNGGPSFHGGYGIQIKLTPKRRKDPQGEFHHDKEALLRWFEDVFGRMTGEANFGGLQAAKIRAEGPDVPSNEFDIMQHRLTRKRDVEIRSADEEDLKHATLAPLAAFKQLYLAAAEDHSDLVRLRHSDAL